VEIHPTEGWRGWFSTSAEVARGGATPSTPLWGWRATLAEVSSTPTPTASSMMWAAVEPPEGAEPPSTAFLYGVEGSNGVDLHLFLFFINFLGVVA
jgi:hypothetical protein